MNAAELDQYMAAESAYNAAKADGKSEADARQAAAEAAAGKRHEQLLRELGIEGTAT